MQPAPLPLRSADRIGSVNAVRPQERTLDLAFGAPVCSITATTQGVPQLREGLYNRLCRRSCWSLDEQLCLYLLKAPKGHQNVF